MSVKRIVIIASCVIVVLALVSALVFFVPVFRVRSFAVQGQDKTSVSDITDATKIAVGDNLMRIDAPAAANNVAQLPWVDKATVTRDFPGTLGIEVQERRAVLWLRRDGDHYLIDQKGIPFIIDTPPEGTVELSGTGDDDQELFADAIAVLDSLDEQTRAAVVRLNVPSRYEFSLFTQDGREVFWGAPENNHNKAVAMKTVLLREGDYWNVSAPTLVTTR